MSKTLEDFLNNYVCLGSKDKAREYLDSLLTDAVEQVAESEIFSPKYGEILDIGDEGDIGFYVVTADERKARSIARKHMLDTCGMDKEYVVETLNNAEKMSLHLYTKPWETGIYSDWNWFAENSEHPKSKWVYKFKY